VQKRKIRTKVKKTDVKLRISNQEKKGCSGRFEEEKNLYSYGKYHPKKKTEER